MDKIIFGPSGNSEGFFNAGHNSTIESAKWCKDLGLQAFEYSFGRGVRMSDTHALELGKVFKDEGVKISAHAPYFINFNKEDYEELKKSFNYILFSVKMIRLMGGSRVVVHPASQGSDERSEAVSKTIENFLKFRQTLDENEIFDIDICIETMGKQGQIGSLSEVIDICKLDKRYIPCIDYGHLNARGNGCLKTKQDFNDVIKKLTDSLPFEKVKNMHVHFSKIMYSNKGELKHLTFEDTIYGPNYEPMIDSFIQNNLTPTVLCESAGTQDIDAKAMLDYYNFSLKKL
jgi:deoxyribonuclease-4